MIDVPPGVDRSGLKAALEHALAQLEAQPGGDKAPALPRQVLDYLGPNDVCLKYSVSVLDSSGNALLQSEGLVSLNEVLAPGALGEAPEVMQHALYTSVWTPIRNKWQTFLQDRSAAGRHLPALPEHAMSIEPNDRTLPGPGPIFGAPEVAGPLTT